MLATLTRKLCTTRIVRFISIHFKLHETGFYSCSATVQSELQSSLVYGRHNSSCSPARFFIVHPIDEPHVGDHVCKMTEAT